MMGASLILAVWCLKTDDLITRLCAAHDIPASKRVRDGGALYLLTTSKLYEQRVDMLGVAACCTSVMLTKFAFLSALWVLKDNGKSAKSRAAAYPAVSTVASDLSKAKGLLPGGGACWVMRSCYRCVVR